jgi:hypothetical protein
MNCLTLIGGEILGKSWSLDNPGVSAGNLRCAGGTYDAGQAQGAGRIMSLTHPEVLPFLLNFYIWELGVQRLIALL